MWTTIRQCEHGLCASSQRRRGAVERGDEPRDPSLAGARPGPRHGSRSRVANDKTRREPTDRSDMRRSVAEQTQRSAVTSNPTVARALAPALGPRRGVANHVPARRRRWALANDGPNVRRSGALGALGAMTIWLNSKGVSEIVLIVYRLNTVDTGLLKTFGHVCHPQCF